MARRRKGLSVAGVHDRCYKVVRMYFNRPGYHRTVMDGCTLAEAQEWCSDPQTSSKTCTTSAGRARTRKMGDWFDGYELMPGWTTRVNGLPDHAYAVNS